MRVFVSLTILAALAGCADEDTRIPTGVFGGNTKTSTETDTDTSVSSFTPPIIVGNERAERDCAGSDEICLEGEAPVQLHLSAVASRDDIAFDLENAADMKEPYAALIAEAVAGSNGLIITSRQIVKKKIYDACSLINVKKPSYACAPTSGGLNGTQKTVCAEYRRRGDLKYQCLADVRAKVEQQNLSRMGMSDPTLGLIEWDFGDGSDRSINNSVRGFNAAKVYDTPGIYTAHLKITRPDGKVGKQTLKLKVNPDTRRPVYIASAAKGDGSTVSKPTSIADLMTRMQAMNPTNSLQNQRLHLYFKQGDSFYPKANYRDSSGVAADHLGIDLTTAYDTVVDSYSDPASPSSVLPLLYCGNECGDFFKAGIRRDGQPNRIMIQNLRFDNNAKGEKCFQNCNRGQVSDVLAFNGSILTLRKSIALNVGTVVQTNTHPAEVLISEISAPLEFGMREYLVWMAATDLVVQNNDIVNSTEEHAVRGAEWNRVLVRRNNLSKLDWRGIPGRSAEIVKGTAVNLQHGMFGYVAENHLNPSRKLFDSRVFSYGQLQIGPLGSDTGKRGELTEFGVIERNLIENSHIQVNHGASNVRIQNNIMLNPGSQYDPLLAADKTLDSNTIVLDGYAVTDNGNIYDRGVVDLSIDYNTFYIASNRAKHFLLSSGAKGVRLRSNLVATPSAYTVGAYNAAPVTLYGADFNFIAEAATNIWPASLATSYSAYPANTIALTMAGVAYSLKQWNKIAGIDADNQFFTGFQSDYSPVNSGTVIGKPIASVYTDYYGKRRPAGGQWTVGAVELTH